MTQVKCVQMCANVHMFWGDISLPQYSKFSTSIINSAALTASSKVTCRNNLLPGLQSWHSFEKLGWDSQRYTASACPEDRGLITFWGTLSTYSAIVSRSCCLLYRAIKYGIFAQWDSVDTTHVFVHFYIPGVNPQLLFCYMKVTMGIINKNRQQTNPSNPINSLYLDNKSVCVGHFGFLRDMLLNGLARPPHSEQDEGVR